MEDTPYDQRLPGTVEHAQMRSSGGDPDGPWLSSPLSPVRAGAQPALRSGDDIGGPVTWVVDAQSLLPALTKLP